MHTYIYTYIFMFVIDVTPVFCFFSQEEIRDNDPDQCGFYGACQP